MLRAYTAAQVRSTEEPVLAEAGGALMERAAFALAVAVLRELRARRGRVRGSHAVLLVGAGNNGGDALHAGAHLARRGVSVLAVTTTARAEAVAVCLCASPPNKAVSTSAASEVSPGSCSCVLR